MGGSVSKPRYGLIDAIRGVAVINMVVYHLCYDIFCVFGADPGFMTSAAAVIWEQLICSTFIAVSGISANFTSHGYRRGIVLSLCGFAITIVTVLFIPEQQIWFGVLNLLGCAMIIAFALREQLKRIAPAAGLRALRADLQDTLRISGAVQAARYAVRMQISGVHRLSDG